jgi:hypothetical protein
MKLPEPDLINKYPTPGHYTTKQMLAWGKANAEAEREACARLVEPNAEHRSDSLGYLGGAEGIDLLDGVAAAIRARGENT